MSTPFPLPGANWTYLRALRLVASTGLNGANLQNGTPTLLQWTAPNDGQLHRFMVVGQLHVTSAETGGQVSVQYFAPFPGATAHTSQLFAAGLGTDTGGQLLGFVPAITVAPGSVVSILQVSALTAGAAVLWAEIWAS